MNEDKIILIGDSALRAFTYNDIFIPIQIANGALNSTLDEDRCKNIKIRYLLFFEEFNLKTEKVWFFSNANPYHYYIDTFDLKNFNDQENILKTAASKYIDLIVEISNKYNLKISIVSALPLMDGEALNISKMYNKYLKYFSEINNFEYINLWEFVTIRKDDTIKIDSRYVADIHGHVSHYFIPQLLKKYNFKEYSYEEIYYDWYYAYQLTTPSFQPPATIWGDFSSYDLILHSNETHFWRRYHKKTRLHISMSIEVLSFYRQIFGDTSDKNILFIDAKEGYAPFRVTNIGEFKNIDAFEKDIRRVTFAKKLQKIFKREDINFYHTEVNKITNNYDIAISLTNSNYDPKIRMKLFKEVYKKVDFFVFYSFDEERDFKLLNKAGFKYIFKLNYLRETNRLLEAGDSLFVCSNLEYSKLNMFKYKFKKLKRYIKKIKDISIKGWL